MSAMKSVSEILAEPREGLSAAMNPQEAFEILETMLHNWERTAADDCDPAKVRELARRRAGALRLVLGMEAR